MQNRIYLIAVTIMAAIWMKNVMALELESSAFEQGGKIPSQYTCDGKNISPPLVWSNIPSGTKTFVLIMEDPDAPNGTWDHWIIYNIPANITSLDENSQNLPPGAVSAKNSWQNLGYGGPCPPEREHRYFFKLFAIDTTLPMNSKMTKNELLSVINNHVIASTELVAKYQRSESK